MNAHPAPPAPLPSSPLDVWWLFALALAIVVAWWLAHASRR